MSGISAPPDPAIAGTGSCAYLDCVGGLAGDMLLAALLDAGAPERALAEVPARLGLEGVELVISVVERHAIRAVHVSVRTAEHAAGGHHHRSWRSILEQLLAADLAGAVRERAIAVFSRLAAAEGLVHGMPAEDVHFHELGAVDTLVDIVGAATLVEELGIRRLVCSPLPVGRGLISAQHGVLPLPAPATVALLAGAPVVGVDLEAELVTPTGAALAQTFADGWGQIPAMTLERIGYGAGSADFPQRPNIVRVLLGTERVETIAGPTGHVVLLETNLDDLLPELVPDAAEACFAAGALDVWTTPVMMKKGRPGFIFSALAHLDTQAAVARVIIEQTSALGVRVSSLQRYELEREQRTVLVAGRPVQIKVGFLDGRIVNVAPEHDDCAAVARETSMPVKSVWTAAMSAARETP